MDGEPPPVHRLHLLDGFRLLVGPAGVELTAATGRLLALLGLRGVLSRHAVAGQLWPDVAEPQARARLRTTLWRLRRVAPRALEVGEAHVALAAHVEVDAWRLCAWARRVVHGDGADEPRPPAGELLPGWYEDWVLLERERVRQLHLHALESLAAQLCRRRRFAEAIEASLEAIALEPLRESAHRVLVEVHVTEGNLAEARRHVLGFRRMLRAELGVEPSRPFLALADRSDRGSPTVVDEATDDRDPCRAHSHRL